MCVECVANLVEHMKDAHIRETLIAEGEFDVFLFLSFTDDFVAAKLLSLFSHFLLVSATISLKKKKRLSSTSRRNLYFIGEKMLSLANDFQIFKRKFR